MSTATWGGKKKERDTTKRINIDDVDSNVGQLKEVAKESIFSDPNQPRKYFDINALAELQLSIEESGLLHPILVCEADEGNGIGKYRILAGERRWRAVMASGKLQRIQVLIRNDINDELKILLAQIAENDHRADMTVIETADGFKRVLTAVEGDVNKAAELLSISTSRLSLVLGLNNASSQVKELAHEGVTTDVNVLSGLSTLSNLNEAKATETIEKIRSGELKGGGVRKAVSEMVREEKKLKKDKKSDHKPSAISESSGVVTSSELKTNNSNSGENIETAEKVLLVEMGENLIAELEGFLQKEDGGDDFLMIKRVLAALKLAKKKVV